MGNWVKIKRRRRSCTAHNPKQRSVNASKKQKRSDNVHKVKRQRKRKRKKASASSVDISANVRDSIEEVAKRQKRFLQGIEIKQEIRTTDASSPTSPTPSAPSAQTTNTHTGVPIDEPVVSVKAEPSPTGAQAPKHGDATITSPQKVVLESKLKDDQVDPRQRLVVAIRKHRRKFQESRLKTLPILKKLKKELTDVCKCLRRPWQRHDRLDAEKELRETSAKIARIETREDELHFERRANETMAAVDADGARVLQRQQRTVHAHTATGATARCRRRQAPKPLQFIVRGHDSDGDDSDSGGDDDDGDPNGDGNNNNNNNRNGKQTPYVNVLVDAFLDEFDPDTQRAFVYTMADDVCPRCNTVMLHDPTKDVYVCANAACRMEKRCVSGVSAHINSQMLKGDRYRRVAYWRIHLLKFQGLFTGPGVTPEVIKELKHHLVHTLNSSVVHCVLEHYENGKYKKLLPFKQYITAEITGKKPPFFTPAQTAQLDKIFSRISTAFDALRQQGIIKRKNMISYYLCAFKALESLVGDWGKQFLKYFRLSHWPEKTSRQDTDWAKICIYNKWDPIKTA